MLRDGKVVHFAIQGLSPKGLRTVALTFPSPPKRSRAGAHASGWRVDAIDEAINEADKKGTSKAEFAAEYCPKIKQFIEQMKERIKGDKAEEARVGKLADDARAEERKKYDTYKQAEAEHEKAKKALANNTDPGARERLELDVRATEKLADQAKRKWRDAVGHLTTTSASG